MEFLSRLNLSETDRIIPNPSNLIFEIGDIQVYATTGQSTLYHDVCGFLFKDSDIICKTGKTLSKQKHEPASRDDIRSAIVKMHSSIPLTPTEESACLLYKTLSGCKKKKSRGKRDEEEELDEDDDEEVLRIVRKKDSVKVPIASSSTFKKSASSFSGSVAKTNALKEDSDDEEIEEDGLEDDEEEDEEELKEEEEDEEEEQEEQE